MSLLSYTARFAVLLLIFLLVIGFVSVLLEVELGISSSLMSLFGAAMLTVIKFIKDNKRPPNDSEQLHLVFMAYLASWFVSIVLIGILASLGNSDVLAVIIFLVAGDPEALIGAFLIVTLIYLVVLYLSFGYFAKRQFDALTRNSKV